MENNYTMNIEYDMFEQMAWTKRDEDDVAFKVAHEAWKVRKGFQDGQMPYAKDIQKVSFTRPVRGVK